MSTATDFEILPTSPKGENVSEGSFNEDNFTIIPNRLFHLVKSGELSDGDLITYAFFLGRCGAMFALKKQDYSALPEVKIAAVLGVSTRTVRSSVERLVRAGIIERLDTRGNTRTRILTAVENGRVVQRPRSYPVVQRKKPSESVISRMDDDWFADASIL